MAAGQSPYVRAWAAAYTEHQPWVLAQFECARPNSIIRRSTEQIMYRYEYFNKNVYFAKHNNC